MEPTHFIEVYNSIKYPDKKPVTLDAMPIEYLKKYINKTASCKNLQTIAVFKIKFKNNNDAKL